MNLDSLSEANALVEEIEIIDKFSGSDRFELKIIHKFRDELSEKFTIKPDNSLTGKPNPLYTAIEENLRAYRKQLVEHLKTLGVDYHYDEDEEEES